VAVRAFTEDGPDVPLDAIAKEAGVGIGTLYRHFPEADTERVGSIRRLGTKAQIRGQYCGGFA
jgi:AcrR family transcriptional regulator